jgi:uncharacterized protein (UPF0276 family)
VLNGRPALCATYEGGEPRLLERMLALVDYIEISPDSISCTTQDGIRLNPEIMAELENARSATRFLVHGVGLSIASAEGRSDDYLRLLDDVFERLPVAWHSEHLGFTRVAGEHLGTMLPPPRTEEALDLICGRVSELRARYAVPFLLEHIVRILPDCGGTYSDAAFMNAIARETGCGFVVDAYNLVCDRENFAFDADAFLAELDLGHAKELHLAGGETYKGFRMDAHSRLTDEPTRALARDILDAAPGIGAITFEFLKQALPSLGDDAVCAELTDLRTTFLDDKPR